MTYAYTTAGYNYADCAYQCGSSSCADNVINACAALGAVCAFLLALMAVIINIGAIISVIISVAIISIIIRNNTICAKEVYLS
ncbi:MAG: hypothetical protein IJ410_01260 [Oscillospiraceae bacterium]|nr:hypothetical protein [Oscillospiraceae bacterium]